MLMAGEALGQTQTTEELVTQAAIENGIDPDLALAIMHVESKGDANAIGALGEVGLFQLRGEFHDVRHGDPRHNVGVALRYLAALKERFEPIHGDAWFVAFNVGPTRLASYKAPRKTAYYQRVTAYYRERLSSKKPQTLQLLPFTGEQQ
jgi:soluble lytic murein transglycosylase-like protein